MKVFINKSLKFIKKAIKWYFKKVSESGCYMCTTGSFPMYFNDYKIKKDK